MSAGITWRVFRLLFAAQCREQPGRLLVTVLAIALGVALGTAVYWVDSAALNEFGLAAKRLVGEADIVVRAPREGFPDALFVELARNPAVRTASPVLELEAALPGNREPLKILCLDPFRAATLQASLIADVERHALELFRANTIILSAQAARQLAVAAGGELEIVVANTSVRLHVLAVLPEDAYPQAVGLMDIAVAQQTFHSIGRLNRIDLRLNPGVDVDAMRRSLTAQLPAGAVAVSPDVERDRAVTVTRAYRVNLNMLALVSLWTGVFLVFSTQSLAVLRRRRALGLMRALGVTRAELERALIGEGMTLGLAGSLLGIALGAVFATVTLHLLRGDLGNGQLATTGATLHPPPLRLVEFVVLGTLVSCLGAWLPARSAARQPAARALKGGDAAGRRAAGASWLAGCVLLILGAGLARLPPLHQLPIFGYASIAALVGGAVLLVPALTVKILALTPRLGRVVPDTALAQLEDNIALSTLSLAAIIVSFSLMVAMAIMVYSFRESFDHWLIKLLPADMQLREPYGNDTAYWSKAEQNELRSLPQIVRAQFRRTRSLILDPARPQVLLIARGEQASQTAAELPLIEHTAPIAGSPVWISEAVRDLYGVELGGSLELPLGGRMRRFIVAGVWRDYARSFGALVITRSDYIDATGDENANEGSLWLRPGASSAAAEAAVRGVLVHGSASSSLEILTSTALRERSLSIFDRAFAITYALEAIAVLIGLAGVSFAASSTALARRAEFGMLRHLGLLRRQVIAMLASEGVLMSAIGVLYGLVLGLVLSLVLVFVVNRQSFNWSIDLAIPVWQLASLALVLIAAAALTALLSGRAVTGHDAVRAVREDW